MLPNDTTSPAYHGDGPIYPGETVHQALGENTTFSLGGHLLNRPAQGISHGPRPGTGFEDEPVGQDEKDSQHVVQSAYRSASQAPQDGTDGSGSPPYSFKDTMSSVRSALRPGT